jgi:hypothetical protein
MALSLSGRIYKRHFAPAIWGDDTVIARGHVQRHVPGSPVIIWDRLNAHRTTVAKEYVEAHAEFEVHRLPPHALDLHPEQGCQGHGKQHLRMRCPPSRGQSAPYALP